VGERGIDRERGIEREREREREKEREICIEGGEREMCRGSRRERR